MRLPSRLLGSVATPIAAAELPDVRWAEASRCSNDEDS
jgi:hypothetical protein